MTTRAIAADELASIVGNVADGITVQGPDGSLLYANDAAARLCGLESAQEMMSLDPAELLARFEILGEDREPLPLDLLPNRRAFLDLEPREGVLGYRVPPNAEERWSVLRSTPILDGDGAIRLLINVFHDVTEERQAQERMRFLAEAGSLLAASLDYEATLADLARLLIPRVADYCIVDAVSDGGELRQVVISHRDPEREDLLRELRRRYPPQENEAHPVSQVLRTGVPYLVEDAREDALERAAVDDDHLRLYQQLQAVSYIVVPLEARGRLLGTISLGTGESGRKFHAAERDLVHELGRRAGLAIDNALLYRAARESYAQLDTLLASAPVAIGFWDRELRFIRLNDALAHLNGLPAKDHLGRTLAEVIPGLAATLEPLYRRVLDTGEPVVHEESTNVSAKRPGEARHWLSSYYPVVDEEGETVGVGGMILEITGQRRADARLRLLAQAGELFSSSLEREEILRRISRVVVPRIADSCNIFLADGHTLQRVASAHSDPELERVMDAMPDRYELGPDAPPMLRDRIARGEPLLASALDEEIVAALEAIGLERGAFERVGSRSMMFVPFVSRGETLGVITLGSQDEGRYTEEDLELARELARRASAALDNARLVRELEVRTTVLEAQQEASPDGLLLVSPEGAILSSNSRFRELWGFSEELLERGSDADALAEAMERVEDPQAFLERVEYLYAHPDEKSLDEIRFKDGTVLDRHGTAVRGADGSSYGFLWSFRDVTERREAGRRLRFLSEASEALAESFELEQTLNVVAQLAVPELADYCFVDLVAPSGAIERVAAVHEGDDGFADRTRAFTPRADDTAHPAVRVLRSGRTVVRAEVDDAWIESMAVSDAHAIFLREIGVRSLIFAPIRSGRRRLGVLTFGRTAGRPYGEADREVAEELAQRAAVAIDNSRLYAETERRAQAATALEYVGDGVVLVDDGRRIRLWNPAAERITGLRAGDLVGHVVDDALPGWPLEELSARPQTRPVDVRGRELWLSLTAVAFERGTVFAFRDLTEERALEQLKTDFVSTVSHELRTPLAAIYGAAMTLQRDDVDLNEAQEAGMLEVIAGESERLARIVNDILLASRLDSGAQTVSIVRTDATELARGVLAAAEAHLPPDVELVLTAPDPGPHVAADEDGLRQVLVNLVENAVKYSPNGGRVELALEPVDGRIRFAVSDRGLGIPPSEHERIFEKFFRLDPNLSRGVGGTGLGLYISRELVRRMGGRIRVDSSPGRGSTFSFDLEAA
jgi:PAS domain S-box-containing protein